MQTDRTYFKIFNFNTRGLVIILVLCAAAFFGAFASLELFVILAALILAIILLYRPIMGLILLIPVTLLAKVSIDTGTEVELAPIVVLIPIVIAIALLPKVRRKNLRLKNRRVNLPLALLLLSGLISLVIGNVLWDPTVPRSNNLLLVQMAQWAVFALSAGGFWLAANLIENEKVLKQVTWLFLILGGPLAVLLFIPLTRPMLVEIATIAVTRAPFWLMLSAIAGGQLLFNISLNRWTKIALVIIMLIATVYAFVLERESASNWVGVGMVIVVLFWFKWSRLRWFALLVFLLSVATGLLIPAVWEFAGGEVEWITSGGSRLVLIERVLEDTRRNPITGLGPAAYRAYGATRPLPYQRAFWLIPAISSHNNFIDIFSHFGLVGLSLFLWFGAEITRLALRLRQRALSGFALGYVNGLIAAGAGALALMMLADWILPFVYNIGFPGFQASIIFWIFLGGLLALDALYPEVGTVPSGKLEVDVLSAGNSSGR